MESNELVSVGRKKIDLITQILYKKYIDEYPWLTFKDLNLMISKFCKDPISDFNSAQIDVYTVREYHTKVYPLIEKINQVKAIRNLNIENELEKKRINEENEPVGDLTPTLSYKSYCVLIDSKDRNISYWPNVNPFQFPLGPSSISGDSGLDSTNNIMRRFSEIHALTVKKIIIPDYDSDESLCYPYLLLKINELNSNINGTNDVMNNCFGYLSEPKKNNGYLYFNYDENIDAITNYIQESHMTKIFSPRIELSKITINILNPSGDIISFDENKSVIVELQITCLKKELENNILIKRGA
tara:strand:- start:350 stop:1246 length:897 start_codon:yes stop_codon:yes gene_type:complete